jgi:hypothetical protein
MKIKSINLILILEKMNLQCKSNEQTFLKTGFIKFIMQHTISNMLLKCQKK